MKDKKSALNILTMLFLFILPFFSTIFLYNRIFTLIEIVFILLIFLNTIIIIPESRKNIKYIFLYLFFVCIYLGINYYRSRYFNSLIPGNFDYSLFSETLTIIKLFTPVLFLYSIYYQRLEYKKYIKVINYWSLLIGLTIIISSLFKFGYSSYSDSLVTANIFDWFKSPYYIDASCRGFFTYANQIAVWLLLLLLVNIYNFTSNNKCSFINIIIIVFSMIILGTRVSTIGALLTFICILVMYFIITLYHKEKINKKVYLLLIPLSLFILIPTSPYSDRLEELEDYQEYEITDIEDIVLEEETDSNYKVEYVYDNYNPNYLPKVFFEEYYSINYDDSFWYRFVKKNDNKIITYRYIENSIIKRVVKINNNKADVLFGISNTRIQNIVNIENDFVLHYYAFGIIGSIILLFYYLALGVFFIKEFFKKQDYKSFIFTTAFLLFIFCSYLTGNIINSINITIPSLFIVSGSFINGLKRS